MDISNKAPLALAFSALLLASACVTSNGGLSYSERHCAQRGLQQHTADWDACMQEQNTALDRYHRNMDRVPGI